MATSIHQNEEAKEIRLNLQWLGIPMEYLMRFTTLLADQDSPGKEMNT